jgi:hypothetical protein
MASRASMEESRYSIVEYPQEKKRILRIEKRKI